MTKKELEEKIKKSTIKQFNQFLKNISITDDDSVLMLHYLCSLKKIKEKHVKMLVSLTKKINNNKKILNCCDSEGNTPLHCACKMGHDAMINILVAQTNLAINKTNKQNRTPLFIALEHQQIKIAELLLNKGAMIINKKKERYFLTDDEVKIYDRFLEDAINKNNYPFINFLLLNSGIPVNDNYYDHKTTPLHIMCKKIPLEQLQNYFYSIQRYKDKQDELGKTPLFSAYEAGCNDIVRWLITVCNVNVEINDNEGHSLLYYTLKNKDVETTELLLQQKATLTAAEQTYFTTYINTEIMKKTEGYIQPKRSVEGHLLCFAMLENCWKTYDFLLNLGADPNSTSKECVMGREPATIIDSALAVAIRTGNAYFVSELINKNAKMNHQNNVSQTPLHIACLKGDLEIVTLLLRNSLEELEVTDTFGKKPLHYASEHGHVAVLKKLLDDCEYALDGADQLGKFALHYARNVEIATALISTETINIQDSLGMTPLHYACHESREDVALFLLDQPTTNIKILDTSGRTPLHFTNNKTIALKLVEKGTDITVQDSDGMTALHCACQQGWEDIVEFLLAQPTININSSDKSGKKPLDYANNKKIIAALIRAGADINAQDSVGRNPLHRTCIEKREIAALALLEQPNLKFDERDALGRTPLHYAYQFQTIVVPKTLLDKRLDPKIQDNEQHTALYYALDHHAINLCEQLLNEGVTLTDAENAYFQQKIADMIIIKECNDGDHTTIFEQHLLFCAIETRLDKTAYLLLELGADPNSRKCDYKQNSKTKALGLSALEVALNNKNESIAQALIQKGANFISIVNIKSPLKRAVELHLTATVKCMLQNIDTINLCNVDNPFDAASTVFIESVFDGQDDELRTKLIQIPSVSLNTSRTSSDTSSESSETTSSYSSTSNILSRISKHRRTTSDSKTKNIEREDSERSLSTSSDKSPLFRRYNKKPNKPSTILSGPSLKKSKKPGKSNCKG